MDNILLGFVSQTAINNDKQVPTTRQNYSSIFSKTLFGKAFDTYA